MSAGTGPARRPPVRPGDVLDAGIEDLAYGGRGVARIGGFVVFVRGALPGERVRLRVRRVRRGFAEADCLRVDRPSADRTAPPCRHFGVCGGCDLQHLEPEAQARAKRAQVESLLGRVAGLREVEVRSERAGPAAGYRARMDFDFAAGPGGRPVLGLHRAGDPRAIEPIDSCLLLPDEAEAVRAAIGRLAAEHRLAPWDPRRRRGLLRRATVRAARATGEILVVLETGRGDPPGLPALARDLARRHPRVVGVVRRELDRMDRPAGESILTGRDHLFEEVDGDRLRIPAAAFFQPNAYGHAALRAAALAALEPGPDDAVLELYAGVGFFTLPVARRADRVVAVEGSREAVAAARDNAARAGIGNARFVAGEVGGLLPGLLEEEAITGVLVDPPRAGLEAGTVRALAGSRASRLAYVACDPATLARDLRGLTGEGGFRVERVVCLDLFPHTHHVECVARLVRSADRAGSGRGAARPAGGAAGPHGPGGVQVEQGGPGLELAVPRLAHDVLEGARPVDQAENALVLGAQLRAAGDLGRGHRRLEHDGVVGEHRPHLAPFVQAVDSLHDDLGGGHGQGDLLARVGLPFEELEEAAAPVEQGVDHLEDLLLDRPQELVGGDEPHADQDLAMPRRLVDLGRRDRVLLRGDDPLAHQEVPQAVAHRVGAREDDLAGVPVQAPGLGAPGQPEHPGLLGHAEQVEHVGQADAAQVAAQDRFAGHEDPRAPGPGVGKRTPATRRLQCCIHAAARQDSTLTGPAPPRTLSPRWRLGISKSSLFPRVSPLGRARAQGPGKRPDDQEELTA
jgi:23S rRNA (uracil1939-C5)-methyltransferase